MVGDNKIKLTQKQQNIKFGVISTPDLVSWLEIPLGKVCSLDILINFLN